MFLPGGSAWLPSAGWPPIVLSGERAFSRRQDCCSVPRPSGESRGRMQREVVGPAAITKSSRLLAGMPP